MRLHFRSGRSRYWQVAMAIVLLVACIGAGAQNPPKPAAGALEDVEGSWQGTLPLEKTPRVVVKISVSDGGTLRGTFSWIDRNEDPIAFSAVALRSGDLEAASDLAGVTYRGKLAADGASMSGTWTQEKQAFPLHLVKVSPKTVWKRKDAVVLPPMATTADPAFEVATIKPSEDQHKGMRYEWRTRQFRAHNATVSDLIKFAFELRDRQIQGAPAWIAEEKFDIAAEPDAPGLPSEQQYHAMMRKLLSERFGLRFHMESRTFPVYGLTRTGDLKLVKGDSSLELNGHITVKQEPEGDTELRFSSESIPELAGILMNMIPDRQVVDETGLSGRFDFTITVPTAALQDPGEKASAFLRAVQPLGFRLVPKKADLPVMMIRQLEHPSSN